MIGSARHQTVNLGVDDLQGQDSCKGRRPATAIPADAELEPRSPVTYPYRNLTGTGPDLAVQEELGGPVPDEAFCRCTAEGLPTPQVGDCLQEACLTGSVGAVDQVETIVELQLG